MVARRSLRRRYRLLLWLDDTGHVEQVAHAIYVDDDMLTERTYTPEPFDPPDEVFRALLEALDVQQRLW